MIARHEKPTTGPAMDMVRDLSDMVPVLVCPDVTLRAVRLSDFEDYTQIVCTERGQYVGGPYSREDAWFDFLSLSSGWMLHGHGGWTIEETDSARLAGFTCLGLEPGDREIELGFLLREWAEGKSYAFQGASAARDYAWSSLKLKTLVSYIDKRNTRSLKLAARLGALDDTPNDFPAGSRMFRHLPPEAKS